LVPFLQEVPEPDDHFFGGITVNIEVIRSDIAKLDVKRGYQRSKDIKIASQSQG
jgi:hypothetical protein